MINATEVAIYNKNTAALIQSFSLITLGGCATGNGDPIVLYDQLADRWFLSEFGPGNSLCTYVSQTPDPTGAYYSYQFNTPSFPDYPKYGVWPDAYYATTNESSPAIYALNRAAMLAGTPASSQRFTAPGLAGFGFEALTPADLDGMTPPPAGSPDYIMRHVDTEAHSVPGYPANDILEIWAFTVNWTTPANSTFIKIADILTAEFELDAVRPLLLLLHGHAGRGPRRDQLAGPAARGDHEPPGLPQLRHAPGVGGQLRDRHRQQHRRRALVRAAQDRRWPLDALPGGHLRAHYDRQPLDGRHRPGWLRQHRPGLQRLQPDYLSLDPLRRSPGLGSAGHAAARRVHAGQRLGRQRQQPLRRLLGHGHRPHRRLHLLVHRPVERRQPVEAPASAPSSSTPAAPPTSPST